MGNIPDVPDALRNVKGWIYEVDHDADYLAGVVAGDRPNFYLEVCKRPTGWTLPGNGA